MPVTRSFLSAIVQWYAQEPRTVSAGVPIEHGHFSKQHPTLQVCQGKMKVQAAGIVCCLMREMVGAILRVPVLPGAVGFSGR